MKKILLIADIKGWIFDRHCSEIKKRITEYEFDIFFTRNSDPRTYDYSKYDFIYQLDPLLFFGNNPPKEKTIIGLRNEFMYNHDIESLNKFYIDEIEKKSSMFHVVNKKQLKEFSQVNKIPIFLVQHGVDTDCFKPFKKKQIGNRIVVGTGGYSKSKGNKGFEIIEKACEIAKCDLNVKNQNFSNGHLNKEQMAEYYNNIDVYCNMSASEGLNNGIMEAGATGVAVICTNVGAANEMIVHGTSGIFVERNAESLAHMLSFLKNDRKKIISLGENFMQIIKSNWSWNVKIEEYRKMIDFAINKKI